MQIIILQIKIGKKFKEFLSPTLEYVVQYDKNKMEKNIKTYSKAIGIKQVQKE